MTEARSPITSHVLDTTEGRPAHGMVVRLDVWTGDGSWARLAERVTDADGRASDLLLPGALVAGTYRVTFETGGYFRASGRPTFYPRVEVVFEVVAPTEHHHIPLLLSPFGYSTYRGS
jgi:5-hydroxyisourate hydrolase